MADYPYPENDFLNVLISHIKAQLADEHFGVSELAQKVNMSRSNLLRKVKQQTGDSVSVFIRRIRLAEAKVLLQNDAITVSEVAFHVGFNSTSYFTRCFREEYGYPPGEESKRKEEVIQEVVKASRNRYLIPSLVLVLAAVIAFIFVFIKKDKSTPQATLEKSIAVLPFKNDSSDSSNVYIINGLMEAILNDLQKIEDLKVISRTTVEKYRGQSKTIPELSQELQVNYFIEGSGQKIGDQILLSIQLIEAPSDKHIWSQRYEREATGIFQLQSEIALQVASATKAMITPEERKRIEKVPTENSTAYDYYLQGLAKLSEPNGQSLLDALAFFKQAIEEDEQFAQAYGYVGICYYYLDIFQTQKKYSLEINTYADKAILIDPELGPGLIAKGLYYMNDEQYELAVEFMQKVLDYYPNDAWVHNFLSGIFANYLPNTEKYLIHAIQGTKQIAMEQDSFDASNSYLHLANALAQAGFISESKPYIQKSLELNPDNFFTQTVQAYVQLAEDLDAEKAKNSLLEILAQDTTNIFVLQEVGKIHYYQRDYENSLKYYEKYLQVKSNLGWDVFQGEDAKIAFLYQQLDKPEQAQKYLDSYYDYVKNDESLYQNLSYAAYNTMIGEQEKAIDDLKAFSAEQNFYFWLILFLEDDAIIQQLDAQAEYKETIEKIKTQFWTQHERLKEELKEEEIFKILTKTTIPD